MFDMSKEKHRKKWTEKELQFLVNHWLELSDDVISMELNRSKGGVASKRNELGLFRQAQKSQWQEWEEDFLVRNFYLLGQEAICDVLKPRKWETIRAYATKQLGLRRKNRLYKHQIEGKRKCKECEKLLEETTTNFYKDGNSFRTLCIPCGMSTLN
ncbi:hypothetical protein JOC75_003599 [Metabacillus crassostreae]|uniref:hypothetical protein n=1 Tax=Metabacillus crassostreae TaxID=929098 RepID=UPI00195F23B1|nr:hypothetical protein [Metabacillus crassostreae]MBM7605576.1 hypothetical protein [Metabacillus crassostreae]